MFTLGTRGTTLRIPSSALKLTEKPLDYRFLIARRYLSGRRSVSLVSRITSISVVGVALGVAALIVVLSVLNGFFDFVRDMLVSYDPHIRIVSVEEKGFENQDSLLVLAMQHPEVVSATAYVEGKAMLLHDGSGNINKVVIVRGVDPEALSGDNGVVAGTTYGAFDLARQDGRPGIVLGRRLGERLLLAPSSDVIPASRVALLSAPAMERMYTSVLSSSPIRQFEVRGLFQLESVFDESHVFVGIEEAQQLFRMGDRISGIDVRLPTLTKPTRSRVGWMNESIRKDSK